MKVLEHTYVLMLLEKLNFYRVIKAAIFASLFIMSVTPRKTLSFVATWLTISNQIVMTDISVTVWIMMQPNEKIYEESYHGLCTKASGGIWRGLTGVVVS